MEAIKFLKPDLRKLAIFILISIILFLVEVLKSFMVFDYWTTGIPFVFSWVAGPCFPGVICSGFYPQYLALDILIWYLVSCAVVAIYDKMKKKPGKPPSKH